METKEELRLEIDRLKDCVRDLQINNARLLDRLYPNIERVYATRIDCSMMRKCSAF